VVVPRQARCHQRSNTPEQHIASTPSRISHVDGVAKCSKPSYSVATALFNIGPTSRVANGRLGCCEEGAAAAFPVFAARGRLLIPRDARIADADNYTPVLDTIHREVDAIEDRVFAAPLSAEEVQLGLLRMQANRAGLLSHARARPAPKTDTHA